MDLYERTTLEIGTSTVSLKDSGEPRPYVRTDFGPFTRNKPSHIAALIKSPKKIPSWKVCLRQRFSSSAYVKDLVLATLYHRELAALWVSLRSLAPDLLTHNLYFNQISR